MRDVKRPTCTVIHAMVLLGEMREQSGKKCSAMCIPIIKISIKFFKFNYVEKFNSDSMAKLDYRRHVIIVVGFICQKIFSVKCNFL